MKPGLIFQLRDQRERLVAEGKAIAEQAKAAGSYTDEQRARRDELIAQIALLDGDIRAEEAMREWAATAPAVSADDAAPNKPPGHFANLGQQLIAVANSAMSGRTDQRLLDINAAAQGASEAIGADGGYLVQQDFQSRLLELVHNTGILSARANRIPIGPNSNGTRILMVDETSRVDGSRWGAVQAYWINESGSYTGSRPKFKPLELTLGKLIGLFYATDELLADSTQLEAVANRAFAEEFGFKVDDAMIRGTGAGQPLGILNAPATVSISKETGQPAATIVAENVEKMFARMNAGSLGNAAWFINQDCWPQIFKLEHVIGTGGVPMYIPAGGLRNDPFGSLLGRPVQPIEQCATVGTVGDIILADFGRYILIEKGGIQTASSIHVQFLTDEMAFRWTYRVNGQPDWSSAVTPFKGTNTVSPFLTLATRA